LVGAMRSIHVHGFRGPPHRPARFRTVVRAPGRARARSSDSARARGCEGVCGEWRSYQEAGSDAVKSCVPCQIDVVPSWMKRTVAAVGWVERYARTRRSLAPGMVMGKVMTTVQALGRVANGAESVLCGSKVNGRVVSDPWRVVAAVDRPWEAQRGRKKEEDHPAPRINRSTVAVMTEDFVPVSSPSSKFHCSRLQLYLLQCERTTTTLPSATYL
jgi:hypothetical protein